MSDGWGADLSQDVEIRQIRAIVPMKPIDESKSRLAPVLSNDLRALLSLGSLLRVIRAAAATPEIFEVVVYGGDLAVQAACESVGVGWREDPGTGLNGCIKTAFDEAHKEGSEYGMFLPADLPLTTPKDLTDLIQAGSRHSITIVPDAADEGTNGLLTAFKDNFRTKLGKASFSKHLDQACERGLDHLIHRSEHLGLDIDTGADVDQLVLVSENLWDNLESEIRVAGLQEFLKIGKRTR